MENSVINGGNDLLGGTHNLIYPSNTPGTESNQDIGNSDRRLWTQSAMEEESRPDFEDGPAGDGKAQNKIDGSPSISNNNLGFLGRIQMIQILLKNTNPLLLNNVNGHTLETHCSETVRSESGDEQKLHK